MKGEEERLEQELIDSDYCNISLVDGEQFEGVYKFILSSFKDRLEAEGSEESRSHHFSARLFQRYGGDSYQARFIERGAWGRFGDRRQGREVQSTLRNLLGGQKRRL
jgi:hypothetical protein